MTREADGLIGSYLDRKVAEVLGAYGQETGSGNLEDSKHWVIPGFDPMRWDDWTPSTDWNQCGRLIETHAIGFVGYDAHNWKAFSSPGDTLYVGFGPTHLIAACRLIVSTNVDGEVEVRERYVDWERAPSWANHVIRSETGSDVWVPQYGGICTGETIGTSMQHMVSMNEGHGWTLIESRDS